YYIPPIFILVVGIDVNFVVSANMNISLGCDFYYENAKRYSYTVQVFAGNVTSDVIDIVEEHYEFTFYVMGTMGLRAGIRAEIKVALFSTEFASVGFSAEAGAYTRVWGYFYYQLEYTASRGRSSDYAGALYFELGVYLEVKFVAQAFSGTFSYDPTLYEEEWPLWSAGMRENIQDFAYKETGELAMKKHIRTLTVPDQVFSMTYLDLKTGDVAEKAFDDAKYFMIDITNKAFSYDPLTNILSVTPDEGEPIEEGEMIITWAGAPLAFTSAPISRTLEIYWDNLNNGYTIIFNPNGGSAVPMILARYNAPITAPAPPEKSGYNFAGWYTDNTFTIPYHIPARMPNTDTLVYAKWVPKDDTPYTVEHYQQNLNNNLYSIVDNDTQRIYGTTDSVMTPQPKIYAGFNTPEAKNLKVAADGSGVMKYYYSRKSFTVTFDPGEAGGEPIISQYKFGKTITPPQINSTGFTFKAWNKAVPETMPAENLTFVAQWSPAKDTPYRVEHYIQNTAGTGYILSQIEAKSGDTNQELRIRDFAKTFEGITFEKSTVDGNPAESTIIKGNGTLVVKLYYTRNVHTVSYVVENGNNTEETYCYGETVGEPISPVKDGYTFSGWKANQNLTEEYTFGKPMPDQDIIVYGALIPNNDTKFLVEHYYQNTTGDGFTLNQLEEKTGTTDETLDLEDFVIPAEGITFEKSTVDGETAASTQIKGDGSLVIKSYYTRNEYTLTLHIKNGGNTEQTYRFGQNIQLPLAPARDGYTFSGWKSNEELTEEFSLTIMPSKNITVYGANIPNSNTPYRVEHYQQNVSGSGYTLAAVDNLLGITDTETKAVIKNYTGFTAKDFNQGTISGDGETVIRIEYDRNIYNVALDPAGGTINTGNVTSYTFGVGALLPTDITRVGYIFDGWFDETSRVTNISSSETGDKSYTAKWSPETNTPYTVKHLREDLDGKYTIEESETKYGTTDTDTAAHARHYTGFTPEDFSQGKISGDGSTVMEIHYARNSYRLSWHL
ncbi:MAG: InlB B-repeat-containing protein, partial [Desulfitobacteriaceae bacterium]|nr:InlB B-repeat-containing protein [Desulfitobacteriaceae bacterium]